MKLQFNIPAKDLGDLLEAAKVFAENNLEELLTLRKSVETWKYLAEEYRKDIEAYKEDEEKTKVAFNAIDAEVSNHLVRHNQMKQQLGLYKQAAKKFFRMYKDARKSSEQYFQELKITDVKLEDLNNARRRINQLESDKLILKDSLSTIRRDIQAVKDFVSKYNGDANGNLAEELGYIMADARRDGELTRKKK